MPSPRDAARYYPVSLDLRGRGVAVVGGGSVAAAKIEGLVAAGARVRLIADQLAPEVRDWVEHPRVEHVDRTFERGDLEGVFLVFCERDDPVIFEEVFAEAEERGDLRQRPGRSALLQRHRPFHREAR